MKQSGRNSLGKKKKKKRKCVNFESVCRTILHSVVNGGQKKDLKGKKGTQDDHSQASLLSLLSLFAWVNSSHSLQFFFVPKGLYFLFKSLELRNWGMLTYKWKMCVIAACIWGEDKISAVITFVNLPEYWYSIVYSFVSFCAATLVGQIKSQTDFQTLKKKDNYFTVLQPNPYLISLVPLGFGIQMIWVLIIKPNT